MQTAPPRRLALFLFLATLALSASAQQLTLPAVPVGGTLQATVTLSSIGGPSLGGITVDLSVVGGCGTFQGSATRSVVTNSSGSFSFVFTPNNVPGNCTIQGRNGNFTGSAVTYVYRPADLDIDQGWSSFVNTYRTGPSSQTLQVAVSANGTPLYGVTTSLGTPVAITGSATPTIVTPNTTSDANGIANFTLALPPEVGVWDIPVRAGDTVRPVRLLQLAPAPPDPSPNTDHRKAATDPLSEIHGATVVSIASSAPFTCFLSRVERLGASGSMLGVNGSNDFPVGMLIIRVAGCPAGTSVPISVEYSAPLPADGVVYRYVSGQWSAVTTSVTGNVVTFTLPPNGLDEQLVLGRPGRTANLPMPAVHDMWWAGSVENGWGLSMAQASDGNVFAAIYAYDDAGKPTWWVMPTVQWDYAHGTFEELLYATIGTPWHAYDKRYLITNKAGAARFAFSGSNATFDYVINGVTGRKSLERQSFGAPDPRNVPNLSGMWWGGESQSGWGVSIVQHDATLFMVWFTYDDTGQPTWYVLPGGAWTGANTYEGRIYKTRGSPWLGHTYDASRLVVTDAGPYRLTFNGASASMAYTIDGRSGTLALVRDTPF